MENGQKVKTEIVIHRIALMLLIVVVAVLGYYLMDAKKHMVPSQDPGSLPAPEISTSAIMIPPPTSSSSLPFYEEIMDVVEPLEYSIFPDLVRPDVSLSINFNGKFWTLHNIHQTDAQGQIVLKNDRYGLCGELAAYTHRKIKPILKDQYTIEFLRAAESGFFLRPYSSHIILVISDKKTQERYFLDPSFARYGKEEDFEDYLFFDAVDVFAILQEQKTDVSFLADFGTPVLIKENFLLYFMVESVEGKFDKDNFVLAVTANKRYKYSGRYVYALRKRNGEKQTHTNEWLLHRLLTPDEAKKLLDKITEWFNQVA